ncbi:hypothetical protein ACA910_010622 [Epithemia clementina (nom. ined.)]
MVVENFCFDAKEWSNEEQGFEEDGRPGINDHGRRKDYGEGTKVENITEKDGMIGWRKTERTPVLTQTAAYMWIFAIAIVLVGTAFLASEWLGKVDIEDTSPSIETQRKTQYYVDYHCETDSDCAIKDIGQCCEKLMACVNKKFVPDNRKRCKELGETSRPCIWSYLDKCMCRNEMCEGYQKLHVPP